MNPEIASVAVFLNAMDSAAISAWVAAFAAFISLAATTFTIGRAWWLRTQADWSLLGEVRHPHGQGNMLEAKCKLSNFGDGDAHRVAVHLRRAEQFESFVCATTALLRPGDVFEFNFMVRIADWQRAAVWVTWTPPPIRRRRQLISGHLHPHECLTPTDLARQALRKEAEDRA